MQILYNTADAIAEADMWVRSHMLATTTTSPVLQTIPIVLTLITILASTGGGQRTRVNRMTFFCRRQERETRQKENNKSPIPSPLHVLATWSSGARTRIRSLLINHNLLYIYICQIFWR